MSYAFIYDASLGEYELAESHPFKPVRLELTRSLLRHSGLLGDEHEVAPTPIKEAQLLRLHDPAFVEAVKTVSAGRHHAEAYSYGLGTGDNPIFPDMHAAIMRVCAATFTAVELVASGRVQRAVNLSGGLHHAHRDRASGFCLYNDVAVAIDHAVRVHGLRVAYVDIDAHHGDGVQELFYEHGSVMTISLHESGRYLFPGTGHTYETGKGAGRGLSVNAPLEPYTEDASYLEVFDAVVPKALRYFQPDLIVLQAGADMHYYDPLADLKLSVDAMAQSYERVSDLADDLCGGRLVATGGGGYDPYRTVPRAWSLLWAALTRQRAPERVPPAWLDEWRSRSPVPLPAQMADDTSGWNPTPRRSDVSSHNRAVATRLLRGLEGIWEESG